MASTVSQPEEGNQITLRISLIPRHPWFPFSVTHNGWIMKRTSSMSTTGNDAEEWPWIWKLFNDALLPLSATDNVLLKYCSSTAHALSFTLLEIPHEPWQFTLMAVGKRRRQRVELLSERKWFCVTCRCSWTAKLEVGQFLFLMLDTSKKQKQKIEF